MFEFTQEVGEKKEKYKSLFFITLFFLLGIVYYEIAQANKQETEINFTTTPPDLDIFVDIAGAVVSPGIYSLSREARVADLIHASGGVTEFANAEWVTKNLNLSQKLEDTQKLYIPFEWDIVEDGESVSVISLVGESNFPEVTKDEVSINTASLEELMSLSGVGEVYAQKIIDSRPYSTLEELVSNSVLSESLLKKIKNDISL